jgi:putative two-component system response regulator
MAIADVYDALRSKRPYKPAFEHQKSVALILDGTRKQFDPEIIEAFKAVEARFAEIHDQIG